MIFSATHTDANKDTNQKKVTGEFTVDFEKMEVTLNVALSNADFADVLFAMQECRDEFQRQIDNKAKCPFHIKDA